MNDRPDGPASPLVTRRTVAKTVAWAAPAIALAAASPAHAASAAPGTLLFDNRSYAVPAGGSLIVRGSVQAPAGEQIPANLYLSNDFAVGGAGGFGTLVAPVVTGDRFEMLIKAASSSAATDTLKVYSPNYRNYLPDETALSVGGSTPDPTGIPMLVFDQDVFRGAPGGTMVLTGKIVMPEGQDVPPGLTLFGSYAVSGWGIVAPGPVVSGNTFSMTITLPRQQGIGQFMVGSTQLPEGYQVAFTHVVNVL